MKGRRTAELLDEQGKFLRIPKLGLASLERVLNGDIMPLMKPPDMPDDEIDVFIDFVRGMLQIDPMARKSAAQLLNASGCLDPAWLRVCRIGMQVHLHFPWARCEVEAAFNLLRRGTSELNAL
ncbi:hypothetical protein E4U11_006434 [Claviceps purpurea]|nr:hypothetical protein E4U11_006434 [Claviceps purpurea]